MKSLCISVPEHGTEDQPQDESAESVSTSRLLCLPSGQYLSQAWLQDASLAHRSMSVPRTQASWARITCVRGWRRVAEVGCIHVTDMLHTHKKHMYVQNTCSILFTRHTRMHQHTHTYTHARVAKEVVQGEVGRDVHVASQGDWPAWMRGREQCTPNN